MTTQQILQGVHDWTNGKIVYDISAAHPDGQGKPTPYADLTAALGTGGANIPQGLRKGGMSVKFIKGSVQSSDNKYIQARCMAQNFTTDVTQWQGIDTTPTKNSKNLITSGAVAAINEEVFGIEGNLTPGYYLNSSNELVADANYTVSDYIELTSAARNITAFYAQSGKLLGCYLISVDENDNIIDVVHENVAEGIGVTLSASATKFRFTFKTGYAAYTTVGGVRVYDAVVPIPGLSDKVEVLENEISEQGEEVNTLRTKVDTFNERTDSKLKYYADAELVNLYNDDTDKVDESGVYIAPTGDLGPDATSSISKIILLKQNTVYTFYSLNGGAGSIYIRLLDKNLQKIKPLNTDGTEISNYGNSVNASKYFTFKTPEAECYAQFTTVFAGTDYSEGLSLYQGTNDGYKAFKKQVPESEIPNTIARKTDLPNVDNLADAELVVFSKNLFDKSKMISGKYIDYTGVNEGKLANISNNAIKVSGLIPVEAGKKYYLTRKSGLAHCAQRFVAADGETPLLPLNIDGTDYSWLNNNNPSWAFLAPENAAYFQFQVTWTDSGDADLTQFEEGTEGTSIVPYSEEKQLLYNELPTKVKKLVNDTTKKNIVKLNFATRATCFIVSDFDTNNNIELDFRLNQEISGIGYSSNPCFNFLQTKLIDKESGNETVIHNNSDDVCPANYNRDNSVGNVGYIGANHAAQCVSVCTVSNHGKTVADIGSKWSNGTYEFTIVAVIDSNTLWLIGDNFAAYPLYSFRKASANDAMTHVSGATHTGGFTVTAVDSMSQWWYAYGMPTTKVYLDGKLITESGKYEFDEMKICEEYDVLNPASVLLLVQAAVGTFTYNPNPALFADTADKMVRHSNTYTFSSATQCFVATSFTTYQNIDDAWFGLTQQAAVAGDNKKLYIPEAVVGSVDYRTIVNLADAANSIMKSDWEDETFPPNRYLEYSDLVAFNCGYLPISAGNDRLNAIGEDGVAIHISSSTKMYPNLFYGKSMTAYENYAGVAWRTYIPRAKVNTGGIISVNQFTYSGKHYVVADFNAVGIYEIELPSECAGKEVSVLRKRDNVTLLTKVPSDTLMVKVDTDTIMYGFIVAVFE